MDNLCRGNFFDVVILETAAGEIKVGKLVSGDGIKHREMDVRPRLDHENVVLEKTILMPDIPACVFVIPRQSKSLEKIVKTEWFLKDVHEMSLFLSQRWIMDVLTGVEHVHRHRLCHLNIDASNILIPYDNTAKIPSFSCRSV